MNFHIHDSSYREINIITCFHAATAKLWLRWRCYTLLMQILWINANIISLSQRETKLRLFAIIKLTRAFYSFQPRKFVSNWSRFRSEWIFTHCCTRSPHNLEHTWLLSHLFWCRERVKRFLIERKSLSRRSCNEFIIFLRASSDENIKCHYKSWKESDAIKRELWNDWYDDLICVDDGGEHKKLLRQFKASKYEIITQLTEKNDEQFFFFLFVLRVSVKFIFHVVAQ